MTRHDLRNALCVLDNLDRHELVDAGVIDFDDAAAWQRCTSNPERFFLRCEDKRADALWRLIEQRMKCQPVATVSGRRAA